MIHYIKCPYCGNELEISYCTKCGTDISLAHGTPYNAFADVVNKDLKTVVESTKQIWHDTEKELPTESGWCLITDNNGYVTTDRFNSTTQEFQLNYWNSKYWAYLSDIGVEENGTIDPKFIKVVDT